MLALLPAQAAHCTTYSTTTTVLERGQIVVEHEWNGYTGAYSVLNLCSSSCSYISSFAFYSEENGIPRLQRLDQLFDDTCHFSILHDTWVV